MLERCIGEAVAITRRASLVSVGHHQCSIGEGRDAQRRRVQHAVPERTSPSVMHKGTDIPEDSPGYAMVQEAQSVYIYRQDRPADAEWCQRAFDLHEDTAALLPQLGPSEHVMKIGARSEVHVQHIRSAWEAKLTDTDEAMATAED